MLLIVITLWVANVASLPYGWESPLFVLASPLMFLFMLYILYVCFIVRSPVRRWQRVLVAICLCIMTGCVFASNWLLRTRFALSQPAMDRAARVALSGALPFERRRIGLYYVQSVTAEAGMVEFVTGQTIADACGFEYDESGTNTDGQIAPRWHVREW